jgi:hypothetical protein
MTSGSRAPVRQLILGIVLLFAIAIVATWSDAHRELPGSSSRAWYGAQ